MQIYIYIYISSEHRPASYATTARDNGGPAESASTEYFSVEPLCHHFLKYIYIHTETYVCVSISEYTCIHMYFHSLIYRYIYIYTDVFLNAISKYIYIYVYLFYCMFIDLSINTYVYIYIYIYIGSIDLLRGFTYIYRYIRCLHIY